MLLAFRSGAHMHLGYGSFGEYVERLFGYRRRTTQEKLRVAEALEGLPRTAKALSEGSLSWSATRELTRVATAETEGEWLEVASDKTVHQLETLVAGKTLGDTPAPFGEPSARRHVLKFEVAPETLALVREALRKLRESRAGVLDDDAALLLMARHVLAGSSENGRSSYQIALSVCSGCGRGVQHAGGELVAVGTDVVAMARCDAQELGLLGGSAANESAHVGAQRRATQTVPPRVRRAVLRRDRGRCVVPGCRNALFIDVHHVVLRSEGGGNDADNLVCLCGAHHRAVHRGELRVAGRVSNGIHVEHADGSVYGRAPLPRVVDAQARAFAALRGLGFREREVRGALARMRERDVGDASDVASVEGIVRRALEELTRTAG